MHRLEAPEQWRSIDFISDVHLSEGRRSTFDGWRRYLRSTTSDAVFMLGDLMEVWVGDDSRHDTFEEQCVEVLSEASSRVDLYFMAGNRDFLLGAEFFAAAGVQGLPDPTVLIALGRRLLLTHGDRLCVADVEYQNFRAMVRDADWQRDFLARPLAERKAIATAMRDASEASARNDTRAWADVDPATAMTWMSAAGALEMIHGHTHRPGTGELAPGYVRHVLTDWDLHAAPPRGEVLRLTATGLSRQPLPA